MVRAVLKSQLTVSGFDLALHNSNLPSTTVSSFFVVLYFKKCCYLLLSWEPEPRWTDPELGWLTIVLQCYDPHSVLFCHIFSFQGQQHPSSDCQRTLTCDRRQIMQSAVCIWWRFCRRSVQDRYQSSYETLLSRPGSNLVGDMSTAGTRWDAG